MYRVCIPQRVLPVPILVYQGSCVGYNEQSTSALASVTSSAQYPRETTTLCVVKQRRDFVTLTLFSKLRFLHPFILYIIPSGGISLYLFAKQRYKYQVAMLQNRSYIGKSNVELNADSNAANRSLIRST